MMLPWRDFVACLWHSRIYGRLLLQRDSSTKLQFIQMAALRIEERSSLSGGGIISPSITKPKTPIALGVHINEQLDDFESAGSAPRSSDLGPTGKHSIDTREFVSGVSPLSTKNQPRGTTLECKIPPQAQSGRSQSIVETRSGQ